MKIKFAGVGIALAAALCLTSCLSTKSYGPDLQNTQQEMSIAYYEDSPYLEMTHYPPAEIANWNVLVVDTGNTGRTLAYLDSSKEAMLNANNAYAAEDCNASQLLMFQDVRLKKAFRNVSYTKKPGEKYDLVILRDFIVVNHGITSGSTTEVGIMYWFVRETTDDMPIAQGYDYLYLGRMSTTRYSTVPNPAIDFGIREANKLCISDLDYFLEGGLDLFELK